MFKASVVLLGLLGGGLVQAAQGPEAERIRNYIQSMNYDAARLLSLREGNDLGTPPAGLRTDSGASVIICNSVRKGLSRELDSITLMSPASGIIFPGALISTNRSLMEGRPQAIGVARGPVTLSVDLPNLGPRGVKTVGDPTAAKVQVALQEIQAEWFRNPANVQGARQSLETEKAHSSEQIALALGVSTRWGQANSFKVNTDYQSRTVGSTCISLFKQVYFTATMDIPMDPASVFGPAVTVDQVRRVITPDNPAGYVKSVDYGRLILLRMDTHSSETEADLEAAMQYTTSGPARANVSADLKAKYERIIRKSTFTVVTLGGNAEAATSVMEGSRENEDTLFKLIQSSATFSRNNPAYPIAYTVNFLKDNGHATLRFTTDYTEWNCTEYPQGFIRLRHAGAYVARWVVTWKERGRDGAPTVNRRYESGQQTAGWTYTLNLPGDATSIHVQAEAATGLLWSPWGECLDVTLASPTNKSYRIKGTTLHRGWDND